jgi:hypothetical protein
MNRYLLFIFLLSLCFALTSGVQAQVNVSPASPTLIDLADDAASVIVGNPAHASVILDNPRRMIVNAGMPGMTNIIVLNKAGKVIFNSPVISGAPTGDLIRIQNACINGGENCEANKIYYCAEGQRCHSVAMPTPEAPSAPPSSSLDESLEE